MDAAQIIVPDEKEFREAMKELRMLMPELRAELINLRGFHFQQHPQIAASQQRLDLLDGLVNRQIERILND